MISLVAIVSVCLLLAVPIQTFSMKVDARQLAKEHRSAEFTRMFVLPQGEKRCLHPHDSAHVMLETRVSGKRCLVSDSKKGTGIIAMYVGPWNPFTFLFLEKVKKTAFSKLVSRDTPRSTSDATLPEGVVWKCQSHCITHVYDAQAVHATPLRTRSRHKMSGGNHRLSLSAAIKHTLVDHSLALL